MRDNPLISLIVPVYNAQEYLIDCIESVLNQDFDDFEAIFIDDGSTDESSNILKKYSLVNSKIRIIKIPNGGVSNARNLGLNLAVGKWACFVDSDDIVSSNYLSLLLSGLDDKLDINYVLSGVYFNYHNKNRKTIIYHGANTTSTCSSRNLDKVFIDYDLLAMGFCYAKLFSMELINKYGLKFDCNLNLYEDLLFNLEYLSRVSDISIISESAYYYRIGHAEGLCSKNLTFEKYAYFNSRLSSILDVFLNNKSVKNNNNINYWLSLHYHNLVFHTFRTTSIMQYRSSLKRMRKFIEVNKDKFVSYQGHSRVSSFKHFLLKNNLFGCIFILSKIRIFLKYIRS